MFTSHSLLSVGRRKARSRVDLLGVIVAIAVSSLHVVGCGSAPARPMGVAVRGEVTLDGQPVSHARIVFVPKDGKSLVASTLVREGRFEIAAKDGPLPGLHRVEVHAETIEVEEFDAARAQNPNAIPPQTRVNIPPRYGTQSSLAADVRPGQPNEFKFPLSSSPNATGSTDG